MALIICGSSKEEVMAKLQDGRAFIAVYEYLAKLRDEFGMDDGRLCRENVTDYFEIDCPEECVDYVSFADGYPTEMTELYRHVILAAWKAFSSPGEPDAVEDTGAGKVRGYSVRVNMRRMLGVLDGLFTSGHFSLDKFEYLERYRRYNCRECLYSFRLLDGRSYNLHFYLGMDPDELNVRLSRYDDAYGRYVNEELHTITPEMYPWYHDVVRRCPR